MKTIILKIVFVSAFLFCINKAEAQTYNNQYLILDIYNNQGQNPHDFIFSYDVVNGQHTCNNNFEVVSNLNFDSTFRFAILLNNVEVYRGVVALPAFGKAFFDNAFLNCYSSSSIVRVVVLP